MAVIRRLATWRAIAYHRPLWQVVRGGDEDEIRRGIQQGIVYCAWPVVEDADGKTAAAVARAWQELGPIFEALSQAGWEPIPYAYAWPRDVVVERYGELRGKIVYLVVYNSASRPVMAQIAVGGLASPLQRRAVDLVSGQKLRIGHGKISMPLEPGQVAVFKLHVPVSG